MAERPTIYPIFLPHAGCPFQCVYCNQHAVCAADSPGQTVPGENPGAAPSDGVSPHAELPEVVRRQLQPLAEAARRTSRPGELAFYGGTFTALPEPQLTALLDLAAARVEEGVFTGIRFSTRPDAMGPRVCALLGRYPVRTVELGVQSLSDAVLRTSRRGYRSGDVVEAAHRVRGRGWSLGLQLMVGLPGETEQAFRESVAGAVSLRPDFVRIYPTLVLADTVLAAWFKAGRYFPLGLAEAVRRCTDAYEAFEQAAIPVARLGLHSDPHLERPGVVLAGPHHPAFGYLVRVEWWRRQVERRAAAAGSGLRLGGRIRLRVAEAALSEVLGPQRANLRYWKEAWKVREIRLEREPHWHPRRFELTPIEDVGRERAAGSSRNLED